MLLDVVSVLERRRSESMEELEEMLAVAQYGREEKRACAGTKPPPPSSLMLSCETRRCGRMPPVPRRVRESRWLERRRSVRWLAPPPLLLLLLVVAVVVVESSDSVISTLIKSEPVRGLTCMKALTGEERKGHNIKT